MPHRVHCKNRQHGWENKYVKPGGKKIVRREKIVHFKYFYTLAIKNITRFVRERLSGLRLSLNFSPTNPSHVASKLRQAVPTYKLKELWHVMEWGTLYQLLCVCLIGQIGSLGPSEGVRLVKAKKGEKYVSGPR